MAFDFNLLGNLATNSLLQQPTYEWSSLADQIRNSGFTGDWNISGIDRAAELAQMMYGAGITDLSKLGVATRQGTVSELAPPWEQPSEDAPLYKDVTKDVNVWTYDGQDRLGLLTADGAGKTYGDYLRSNEKGDYEFASSMKGDGNVSYQLVQKADGSYAPVPVWGSSSDMGTVRDVLKGAALMAGAAYGLGGLGGVEGAGAAGAAEAGGTLADMTLNGLQPFSMADAGLAAGGAAGLTGVDAAMADMVASTMASGSGIAGAAGATGGLGSTVGSALSWLKDNGKLASTVAGGLLGGVGGSSGGSGYQYNGPMPTISRGNWNAAAPQAKTVTPNLGLLNIPQTGVENSGMWRFLRGNQ